MTLTPNYETFECQFSYGATPPDPADDVAFSTRASTVSASEALGDESCGNLRIVSISSPRAFLFSFILIFIHSSRRSPRRRDVALARSRRNRSRRRGRTSHLASSKSCSSSFSPPSSSPSASAPRIRIHRKRARRRRRASAHRGQSRASPSPLLVYLHGFCLDATRNRRSNSPPCERCRGREIDSGWRDDVNNDSCRRDFARRRWRRTWCTSRRRARARASACCAIFKTILRIRRTDSSRVGSREFSIGTVHRFNAERGTARTPSRSPMSRRQIRGAWITCSTSSPWQESVQHRRRPSVRRRRRHRGIHGDSSRV